MTTIFFNTFIRKNYLGMIGSKPEEKDFHFKLSITDYGFQK
jgi:hypothetical protein